MPGSPCDRSAQPRPEPRVPPVEVRAVVERLLHPGHFFVGKGVALEWEHRATEETAWELHRGRLLDPAHSRGREVFEAWNIYQVEDGRRSGEPVLSLKLDGQAGRLHVVRGLCCHVWEGYHAGDNVYLSRETTQWVRELVGTIVLAGFPTPAALEDEIAGGLFRAVVGVSRLPV